MGRTGVAVDAAMFAALVGIDGPVETDVRTGVAGDDRPGAFRRQGGAQRRGPGVVGGPAVVEGLHGFGFEPARRIGAGAPSSRRLNHAGMISPEENKARTFVATTCSAQVRSGCRESPVSAGTGTCP